MLVILLAMSTNLMAVDYYVDPTGTDDGEHGGSTGTGAWATIEYAINTVSDPATATIVIYVAAETYNLFTEPNTNPIQIDRAFTDLTIQGAGEASTFVQGNTSAASANSLVFDISGADENVTLKDMTIRNGNYGQSGSGIQNNFATLNLTNCTISGNTGTASGSGIFNKGNLTMTNCTVSGNSTNNNADAGGILNYQGTLTMTNCTISENTTGIDYAGGGIYNYDGTVTLTNCTISGNDGGWGAGGIYNDQSGASITMTNCTVSGNDATDASGLGGGFYLSGGTLNIKNTIIANNTDGSGGDDYYYYAGTLTDNGYNIVEYQGGASNQFADANGNILDNQANLWGTGVSATPDLADNNTINGTQTLKTLTGSVAIDAGTSSGAPSTDQRGAGRNDDYDIGAYEWWDNDGSLPVTLSSFTAQYLNDTPTLCWTTQSETNNAGWNVYRGETNEALSNEEAYQLNLSLGLIPGAGTTSEPTDYSFEDVFPVYQGTTYFYWLESVDYSGESEIYGPISLTIPEDEWENPNSPEIPKNYGLRQNYPNPFNPNTEISFIMKENCIAELAVYNIKGEKIATLFQNKSVAKDELIRTNWDGKDETGKAVSSGIYLYKLRTNKEEYSRKMILLK